jgi:hypothetical protein
VIVSITSSYVTPIALHRAHVGVTTAAVRCGDGLASELGDGTPSGESTADGHRRRILRLCGRCTARRAAWLEKRGAG